MQNTWYLKHQNGNNSYFSVGETDTYFVDGKIWMRKVFFSPRKEAECSILFFQHQWMPFSHQRHFCSGWVSVGVSLDQPCRPGRTQPILNLASSHHNRKFGQAQLQLLTFHLEQQFSLEWEGATVKRWSDYVSKVLFKGDCISQIRGSLLSPLSLQKVNTAHGFRQQSQRVALHPFFRMHPVQSDLCKDHILNWEVRVTLPHLEMRNLFLQFL